MYEASVTLLALLSSFALAYAFRMRARVLVLRRSLRAAGHRESQVLEAVRVLTAASRESTHAVLTALDCTLRVLEPAIDAVLIFTPSGEELTCSYAGGVRTQHFEGARLRLDEASSLPARAALRRHRIELEPGSRALIPTDRAALAVPMFAGDALAAVVYASSIAEIRNDEVLVRAVAQAASPYALASEREADRARATFDALTGLYTPRALREKLREDLSLSRVKPDASLALWFVDTDRFKCVNDTLGHAAGDALLQRMARLLQEHTVAGMDLAARNGGDEFCAVLRNVEKVAAIERAQRFCRAVAACDFGVSIPISASIGVAAYPYDAATAEELLEAADAAMYHSKRSGRNCVSFVTEGGFAIYG